MSIQKLLIYTPLDINGKPLNLRCLGNLGSRLHGEKDMIMIIQVEVVASQIPGSPSSPSPARASLSALCA